MMLLLLFCLAVLGMEAQSLPLASQPERLLAFESRVVGGTPVTSASKYPFFVEWEDAKCGASLIHDDIAISAAHCENPNHPLDTRVFLLGLQTETGLPRFIERQLAHPLYSGSLSDYDFLLLKLSSSALVDGDGNPTGAATVELNRDPTVPAVGDALTGMGYGKLREQDQDTSPYFNEVEVYAVDEQSCQAQYGIADFIPEIMFCAAVPGGGRDTCQGDSGGPILHPKTNTQVGLVSFGIGCAQAEYAGVNSRISAVIEWIDDAICQLSNHPPARCSSDQLGPAPSVFSQGGVGQVTVHVNYDDYPEETAWSLSYTDESSDAAPLLLYLQPFAQDHIIPDRGSTSQAFQNLPAGTYSLVFADQAGDSMCCSYGDGKVWLTDDLTGETIWSNDGKYQYYVQVEFEMDSEGAIVVREDRKRYDNSWEAFQAVNHPPTFDEEWPGPVPETASGAVTVNVKFDAFPEENEWSLYRQDGRSWTPLKTFAGETEGVHNSLVSVEIDDLLPGWHRFSIDDQSGDGICCDFRRGWVSVTGPVVSAEGMALIWGNNGEFGKGVDVYFLVDDQGWVIQVSHTDPASAFRSPGSIRKTPPGGRRDLEQQQRHPLSLGTWTDLPKQQLKRLPTR